MTSSGAEHAEATPVHYLPEQYSDARRHVLDDDCWCSVHHADNIHVLPAAWPETDESGFSTGYQIVEQQVDDA
ncbi:hypothetical protein [Gordonia alkanivorans]|uniref:hypothetical protein n=1 Tax=Gordonia alkanivorans TaxID=84096 RepID=UPI0024B84ADB|nr:hypothetical protein [Gordonia alkanivorans]MDJ0010154.1 hypothetical protein [Gordonia alkanivorans]MDJ0495656.1 hypothetical protein [Gordonia alkanivorans]